MQVKRIVNILNSYNCEVAYTWHNRISFRLYGDRYEIRYNEDNKTYSFRKYGIINYISENRLYKDFKKDLIAYLDWWAIFYSYIK